MHRALPTSLPRRPCRPGPITPASQMSKLKFRKTVNYPKATQLGNGRDGVGTWVCLRLTSSVLPLLNPSLTDVRKVEHASRISGLLAVPATLHSVMAPSPRLVTGLGEGHRGE